MRKIKGFTLTETIVVIVIIGIISAVLIPYMINTYNDSKEQIIEIRNDEQETYNIDKATGEILESTEGYKLIDIEYKYKQIICYWEKE